MRRRSAVVRSWGSPVSLTLRKKRLATPRPASQTLFMRRDEVDAITNLILEARAV